MLFKLIGVSLLSLLETVEGAYRSMLRATRGDDYRHDTSHEDRNPEHIHKPREAQAEVRGKRNTLMSIVESTSNAKT